MHSSRQGITTGKYKTKAIQADLGIFTHIPAYSDISGIFKYIQNSGKFRTRRVFRTMANSEPDAYSEPSYMQKPGLIRTLVCSKIWHIQNQRHIHDPDLFRTQIFRTIVYSEPQNIFGK